MGHQHWSAVQFFVVSMFSLREHLQRCLLTHFLCVLCWLSGEQIQTASACEDDRGSGSIGILINAMDGFPNIADFLCLIDDSRLINKEASDKPQTNRQQRDQTAAQSSTKASADVSKVDKS
jgi:hypothetical protein